MSIFCSLFPSGKIETLRFVRIFRFILIIEYWHTFATLSLQNGVDVKTLSNTLGHYSAGFTLDTYTHATQRMRRDAADTIGSVIDHAM